MKSSGTWALSDFKLLPLSPCTSGSYGAHVRRGGRRGAQASGREAGRPAAALPGRVLRARGGTRGPGTTLCHVRQGQRQHPGGFRSLVTGARRERVYELPGPRATSSGAFRRLISLHLETDARKLKHRYHGRFNTAWRGYRLASVEEQCYHRALPPSERFVKQGQGTARGGSPSKMPSSAGEGSSVQEHLVGPLACRIPCPPASKRRCLGALPEDLSTLIWPEKEVAASGGYRPQPGDFEQAMMIRPGPDLLRVDADTSDHHTFILGLCAAEGCPEGWALGVESATVRGFGDGLSVFDGRTAVPEDGDLKDVAFVALTLVKLHQHTLRRWLGVTDPNQGRDLLAPKLDVGVRISPSLYERTGGSIGAAILVSLMALATGLSARKDVAVTGSLNLRGQVEPVDWLLPKARAAATAGATALVLPYDCPMPEDYPQAPPAGQQQTPRDDGKRTHLGGVELRRVRDMWDLALATLSPLPACAPPKPLTTDDRCYAGYAGCGTCLVQGGELSTYLQVVECVGYPSGGTGGNDPIVTGLPSERIVTMCNQAVMWLHEAWATRLQGAVRWESMDGIGYHFHLGPGGKESEDMHLAPAIYMALVSAATGWKADIKVSIFAEVTMHGGVLKLARKPTRLDMAIIRGLTGVDTLVVPEGARAGFQEAWWEAYGEADRSVRFVGIRSIWEALPTVFGDDYHAWRSAGPQGRKRKRGEGM